jgi:hypothetical protein
MIGATAELPLLYPGYRHKRMSLHPKNDVWW